MTKLSTVAGESRDTWRHVVHKLPVRQRIDDTDGRCDPRRYQFLLALLAVQHPGRRRRAALHGPGTTELLDRQRVDVPGPWPVGAVWCRVSVVLAGRLHATETSADAPQSVVCLSYLSSFTQSPLGHGGARGGAVASDDFSLRCGDLAI